ncbi:unnamed protein product [Polarella glacialis]|uniref:WW domain-containing protein n=1 Tax=Polarella glacialis TaxID=89957 RepID=A0A813D272_POLGL|nr:unnamed protein product [Polarella glacialis]
MTRLQAEAEVVDSLPPIGVLQCEACNCRVTGICSLHCCVDCAQTNGVHHGEQCLQVPLEGFAWDGCDKSYVIFAQRLRSLLTKLGPIHLCSLPHGWDEEYGEGSWAEERPVRSASKACSPPYASGITIIGGLVYVVEELPSEQADFLEAGEVDMARVQGLSAEACEAVESEFAAATGGYEVSTLLARAGAVWRCRLSLSLSSDCGLGSGTGGVEDQDHVELTENGFGTGPDGAVLMARIRLLEKLGRWGESADEQLLHSAMAQAKQLEAEMRAFLLKAEDAAGLRRSPPGHDGQDADGQCPLYLEAASQSLRSRLEAMVNVLCQLLIEPPRCRGTCWALLGRVWPHLLAAQDESWGRRLGQAARSSPTRPCLALWSKMAEAAAWHTDYPGLEILQDLHAEETQTNVAAAYAQHHLFSLMLEQRAQLRQELEKCSSHSSERQRPVWDLREDGFGCSFDAAIGSGSIGKFDAVLMVPAGSGQESPGLICEMVGDSRVVSRAGLSTRSGGVAALCTLLACPLLEVSGLAFHATVHVRQRDALHAIVPVRKGKPFDLSMRGAIIETWALAAERHDAEARLHLGIELAGSMPQSFEPKGGDIQANSGLEEAKLCDGSKGGVLLGSLTAAQKLAVNNATSRCVSLVRGPPGTGKTHVAAAIAVAACARLPEATRRVLAVTQSHAAAANLHKRLEAFGASSARIGTTLRPSEVTEQAAFETVRRRWSDDADVQLLLGASSRGSSDVGMKSVELQRAQFAVMRRMARLSQVVVLTCASSGNAGLLQGMGGFPLLVLDEAAQCVEPSPLVPLSWGCEGMALVGDEKQLPATVLDRTAECRNLGVSLFERFVRDGVVSLGAGFVQLDEQRRMHPSIAAFPSKAFYAGTLQNGADMAETRPAVPGFDWPARECRVCFVNCGAGGQETGRSHSNLREAELLLQVLCRCLACGTPASEIGIVTGYSAQQALLKRMVVDLGSAALGLRVDTIDGFQGAERDLILASTVRANYSVGFMKDPRRVNVLLTRARRGLIVFGDAGTLRSEAYTWSPWVDWVTSMGAIMSAAAVVECCSRELPPPPPPASAPPVHLQSAGMAVPLLPTAPSAPSSERDTPSTAAWLAPPAARHEPERTGPERQDKDLEGGSWEAYLDPASNRIWLFNEVTEEVRWKD